MSLFNPIPTVSKQAACAPIAKQLAAFEEHKQTLLDILQHGRKIGPNFKSFDADKSWNDITLVAHLYFGGQVTEQNALPTRERIKRLHQLAKALRQADGLTQRAIRDGLGEELYRAWFAKKNISPIFAVKIDSAVSFGKDGSSPLTRIADDIKEMVEALATLATLSDAAAAADVPSKTGRPALLPRFCIQGLARVYRSSTGAKPGRGAGPFADFAYEFMIAVGQTDFEYVSLTDAIQDAHRLSKPSWFDETT
jgi:hypothetical protein